MKISVCIATHNGAKYIREQLSSILSQLQATDEVIISDDSSTDMTLSIIRELNDSRVIIYENNTFFHHTSNFEFAISKSTGDYIFLSDQDDVWLPSKVETMLASLKEFNLVVSDCYIADANLQISDKEFRRELKNYFGLINNLWHNNFLGCCMAFDREIVKHALPFPQGVLSHESWLGAIAEVFGKTKFLDDKLILFRRHESNNSSTLKGSDLSLFGKFEYRFFIFYNILLRLIQVRLRLNSYKKNTYADKC